MSTAPSQSTTNPTILAEYQLLKRIDKGAFGTVFKAIHLLSSTKVAIKQIRLAAKEKDKKSLLRMVARELCILD